MKHPKATCLNTLMPVPPPLCSRDIHKGVQAILRNTQASLAALCPVSSQTATSNSWKNLTSVQEELSPYKASRAAEPGMKLPPDAFTRHNTLATNRKAQGSKHQTGSLKAQPRGTDLTAETVAGRGTEHQSALELQLPVSPT